MKHTLSLLPFLAPVSLAAVSLCMRRIDRRSERGLDAAGLATGLALGLALFTAAVVMAGGSRTSPVLGIGDVGLSLRLDPLSATMFTLVSFVGCLVVRYSRNYLAGDERRNDFVARLCLALAAVSLLVLAGNLTQLVVAWVTTSLALHRLLIFFKDRPRAVIAGRKKMIAARLGDVCLVTSAVLLAQAFDSSDIATIAERARSLTESPTGAGLAMWLLVAAAVLKSAQFPFHAWLPEVMETPTPVSALLHAGMINSGGFLILRFADAVVLEPAAMVGLLTVGAVSAVFGSLVMLTQTTIKGTLAYSTLAQMGFMMVECGLGAFGIAMLHIVGHSLYKAHAFLSAGGAVLAGPTRSAPPMKRASAAVALAGGGLLAVGACALLLDPSAPSWPVTVGLTSVLAFGVVIWAGQQRSVPGPASAAAAFGITIATPLLFLALKAGAEWVYEPGLPATLAPSDVALAVLAATLLAFAAIAWLQLVGFPTGSVGRRAYQLLRSGAYAGAMWDRWTGALRVHSRLPAGVRGSSAPRARAYSPGPSSLDEAAGPPSPERIGDAVARAARVVPPLWPLSDFVAVNPFLGRTELDFEDASARLEQTAGARTVMPRSYYAAAIDRGEITLEDLGAAVEEASHDMSVEALARGARASDRAIAVAPTVADVAGGITQVDAPRVVVESISDWAGSYFDRGQSKWPSPWRNLSPYRAWRSHAILDRAPALLGLTDVRRVAADLPDSPEAAILECARRLGLAGDELDVYFERLLLRIDGWAGHLRHLGWSSEIDGEPPAGPEELLAISLAWEVALLEVDPRVANAWRIAKAELGTPPAASAEREIDLALHRAFEIANQRLISERLAGEVTVERAECAAQVVFCIDVRSERMRRSLENVAPEIRTLGFAGFFGMAIEWIPLGEQEGSPYCPVLLKPAHAIRETHPNGERLAERRSFRHEAHRAWATFKGAAVASFGFVETMGLGYGVRLVADSLRRAPTPASLERDAREQGSPGLAVAKLADRSIGMPLSQRIDAAEGALRAMSLTESFAPIVVLSAHGSTTANNPYASGLDCGACGGRSGEPNARVAAAVCNDPDVRHALRERGIEIPDETHFVAAVHDTTTDLVRICDPAHIPASHRAGVDRLRAAFAQAGAAARAERAPLLGVADADERQVLCRATDWSQVRPEWGLAGCTSFIAAPRRHTAGVRLDTSAFLHEYVWQNDTGFRVLEQIMTAPMVVATWINLQYFASTVDNRAFGAGDKVLHNVAGGLGVVEGNGGDLRVGLPFQSVHDGHTFVHRPCRLTAAISAPPEAMSRVIERNPAVRDLVDRGWIHLVALNDEGRISHRYVGGSQWTALPAAEAEEVAA